MDNLGLLVCLSRDSLMVRYRVHTPGTGDASDGPTPSPAIMHFIIYKITNLLNGMIYIGKHTTNDLNDGYMGSSQWLKNSIKKHRIR